MTRCHTSIAGYSMTIGVQGDRDSAIETATGPMDSTFLLQDKGGVDRSAPAWFPLQPYMIWGCCYRDRLGGS